MNCSSTEGGDVTTNGKPGPGWYFDPYVREWCVIPEEARAEARSYIDQGYHQISAKYRLVGRYADKQWGKPCGPSVELSLPVFASFREQRHADAELHAYREREARRLRARRLLEIVQKLPADRAEEFLLDMLTGYVNEYGYAREVGILPPLPEPK
jgi:hypothetical protein